MTAALKNICVKLLTRSEHTPSRFYFVLYYYQQMHINFTKYHTPTCYNNVVSSSGSW